MKRFTKFDDPTATILLFLIISGDLFFIILHLFNYLLLDLHFPILDVSFEGGYAEMYQYIKFLWIVILFVSLTLKYKILNFIPWALVFLYFLLDDSLQIHERLGVVFTDYFDVRPLFILEARELGELAVSALVLMILLPALLWAYLKGSNVFKMVSRDITILIIILVFFAVVVDALVPSIAPMVGWKITALLTLVEDSGEMIIVSFLVWYLCYRRIKSNNSEVYLIDLIVSNNKSQKVL